MAADADAPDGELTEEAASATDEGEPSVAAESEAVDGDTDEAQDYEAAVDDDADGGRADGARRSHVRLALLAGSIMLLAVAATVGWLGVRAHRSDQTQAQRQLFLQVGRQCALNLTTIDWEHADGDVQRLLDSATGKFYDQFSQRKQPFIEMVKKAQSKSVGTITEAGVESESADRAQVLVAVSIKSSNLGAADQPTREWRMRITVEKAGGGAKISDVAFVP
jgi:Mce-associated membrane protein